MVDWSFIDHAGARYTAYFRVRMMDDSILRLSELKKRRDSRSISKKNYTDAAAVNVEAYIDQLSHLPKEFWEPIREASKTNPDCKEFLYNVQLLVAIRNNIAHCYLRAEPNHDLIYSTANSDLPEIHRFVKAFYDERDLMNHKEELDTGMKVPAYYNLDNVGRVHRYTDVISYNRKAKRSKRS